MVRYCCTLALPYLTYCISPSVHCCCLPVCYCSSKVLCLSFNIPSVDIYQATQHIVLFTGWAWDASFGFQQGPNCAEEENMYNIIIVITCIQLKVQTLTERDVKVTYISNMNKRSFTLAIYSETWCLDFVFILFLRTAIIPISQVRQCLPMPLHCFKKTLCEIIILGKLARIWREVPSRFIFWSSLLLLLV